MLQVYVEIFMIFWSMALVRSWEQVYIRFFFHLIFNNLQDKNDKFDFFNQHSPFQQNYMNKYKTNHIRLQKRTQK